MRALKDVREGCTIRLFIVGFARSGTTWLRTTLNTALNLVVPPECSFVTWLHPEFGGWSRKHLATEPVEAFVSKLVVARKFENWGITSAEIIEGIDIDQPVSYSELSTSVYRTFARKNGVGNRLLGDKNNVHGQHLKLLAELFPLAKFLHLVRDPFEVYVSLISLPSATEGHRWAPPKLQSAADFALKWKLYFASVEEFYSTNSSRMLRVHYENCISQPAEQVELIRDFIGAKNLRPRDQVFAVEGDPELKLPWKKNVLNRRFIPNASDLGDVLTDHDTQALKSALGPEMAQLGYFAESQ